MSKEKKCEKYENEEKVESRRKFITKEYFQLEKRTNRWVQIHEDLAKK